MLPEPATRVVSANFVKIDLKFIKNKFYLMCHQYSSSIRGHEPDAQICVLDSFGRDISVQVYIAQPLFILFAMMFKNKWIVFFNLVPCHGAFIAYACANA